jgi:hypothetical protein
MIMLNREMSYISQYVAEKEFFLPDLLRKAISDIHYNITRRKVPRGLAVHIVNNIYKTKFKIDYGKEFLHGKYKARQAHIKHGKRKFKEWAIEMRMNKSIPKIDKLCECGCGESVKNKKSRFIQGHNVKMRTKEEREFYTEKMLKNRKRKKAKVIEVNFLKVN